MALRIDPTTLYTRSDLIEMLDPLGIKADSFIAKVKPARRFRPAYWGADLIEAIGKAPELGADDGSAAPRREIEFPMERRGKRGSAPNLEPLERLIRPPKESAR